PLIYGFATHQGSAVGARSDEECHLVLSTVNTVPMSSFLINQPSPGGREVVTFGRLNEPRCGCTEFHVVRNIEATCKEMWEDHFGTGVRAGKQQLVGIGITGGNNRLKPWVQSANEGRQGPTPRATCGAKAHGIHVRAADQVVYAALRVPNEVAGRTL